MLQLIFFQSAFIFQTLVLFSEIMFFKALSAFKALYFSFHSALFHSQRFISFMALYFVHGAFIWQRAFVQVFLSAGKRFIIALSLNYLSASKCLYSKYGTVSNFLFQNMYQLLFEFLDVKRFDHALRFSNIFICFSIMFKTNFQVLTACLT